MPHKPPLLRLAYSVADQRPIDWDAEQSRLPRRKRPIAQSLWMIDLIASARRNDNTQSPRETAQRGSTPEFLRLLGAESRSPDHTLLIVAEGLPPEALTHLSHSTGVAPAAWEHALGLSKRRRREAGRYSGNDTERLLRAARVFVAALSLFNGQRNDARGWLWSPQLGLGGVKPIALLGSETGAREIEALIQRLEEGVPL